MAEPFFEQRQIPTNGPWITGLVSLACFVWLLGPWDATRNGLLMLVAVVAFASTPFLFFGLPMLLKRHHVLVVDEEGLWIDGELAVAAEGIAAVGMMAKRTAMPSVVLDAGRGRFYRYRFEDVGEVLVLPSDRARGDLYSGLTGVVVAGHPWGPDLWDGPSEMRPARCVHTREPEALLEALVACAPGIEVASTILTPEYGIGLGAKSVFGGRYHHPVTGELILTDPVTGELLPTDGDDVPDEPDDPVWPSTDPTRQDRESHDR